jgi:hypothetical protein
LWINGGRRKKEDRKRAGGKNVEVVVYMSGTTGAGKQGRKELRQVPPALLQVQRMYLHRTVWYRMQAIWPCCHRTRWKPAAVTCERASNAVN